MAAYLICVTSEGGIPLFTRKKGDLKPLPFVLVGSLNGIHMFTRNQGVTMLNAHTKDSRVVWKDYHNSITLILVTNDDLSSDLHSEHLLDLVFHSMVLLLGLDEIIHPRNLERLKRDIRGTYWLIDEILEQTDSVLGMFGDVTQAADCMLCPSEAATLQGQLDSFVENEDSLYGCLLVHGKVCAATKKWWTFAGIELALLSFFVNRAPRSTCRDVPVFLPIGSPNVPHRLLTFQLTTGIEVCLLCGPSPTLAEVESDVFKFWRSSQETLRLAEQCHPRNIPPTLNVDKNIMGFMLVSRENKRCYSYIQPFEEHAKQEAKATTVRKRFEVLKSFYKTTVNTIFSGESSDQGGTTSMEDRSQVYHTRLKHPSTETYLSCDQHKCYAIQAGNQQLFVLFSLAVPNFALRSTTHKLLKVLTKQLHH